MRRWLIRLGLVLGGLLAPLAAAELALRLFGPILPGNYETGVSVRGHPVYRRFHVAGSTSWVKTPEYTAHLRFNSHGLRGGEIEREKPPGVARVLLLGDSFVEGRQVSENECLAARLDALLDRSGRSTVEVLNAGVDGWSPVEEYLYLREEGLDFSPDLVVLALYVGNDVGSAGQRQEYLREPHPVERELGDVIADPFRERSMLFRVLETGVVDKLRYEQGGQTPRVRPRRLAIYNTEQTQALTQGWRVVESVLERYKREANGGGARAMLLIIPSKWQVHAEDWAAFIEENDIDDEGDWDLEQPNERLVRIARRHELPVLDLLPKLREAAEDGKRLYYREDVHWTPEGHAVAADALDEYIRQSGLLSPSEATVR